MSAPSIDGFVDLCLAQSGEVYVYGAEVPLDANLAGVQRWDCSELVQVVAHQTGGFMPDGSASQLAYCQRQHAALAIDAGIRTRGALLFVQTFKAHHVAVSLGDGNTIEARGRSYGVGVFGAHARPWTHAAKLPGFTYPDAANIGGLDVAETLTPKEVERLRDVLATWGPVVDALLRGRVNPEASLWEHVLSIEARIKSLEAAIQAFVATLDHPLSE